VARPTLLALCALAAAGCGGGAPGAAGGAPETTGPAARAEAVVDGDTLDVRIGGVTERVRIVGINAPERGECRSAEATERLTELVEGAALVLLADESDRDRFGRLLRYVEADGRDVGEQLVREGAAVVRVSAPDTAREDRLRAAQADARRAGAGLWGDAACGAPVAGATGMRIAGLRLDAVGDDAANANDEWVEVANAGTGAVDLTGWTLRDESASHRFTFPGGFVLAPGAAVRVRSGCGDDSATDLHWCVTGSAVWNNDGDTAFLLDPGGNVVDDLHEPGS